jgi:class 3 adenylate cyclase/tetratricopeptide (TPR) repeat protein
MNDSGNALGDLPERPDALSLAAFVPELIRRRVTVASSPPSGPLIERFPAVLLFADLFGFSTLAESLARRGPRGAEDLKDLLNLFFGRLVDVVSAHGGQILKFPGDAALAAWPVGDDDVSCVARRAAWCAYEAQRSLRHGGTSDGLRPQVRMGIGIGDVKAATVGGVSGRWELLVTGHPLRETVRSALVAGAGEVAVSAGVRDRIASYATLTPLPHGVFRLESLTAEPPGPAPHSTQFEIDPVALRAYVPRSVQVRLGAGQTDWLAEFRRVSVLFINLETFDTGNDLALEQLQRAMVAVQTTVYRYGGSINQMLADDKGTVVVCGWGIALHAHADDAVRAVRAAFELRPELGSLGLTPSFGLATGEVFTGLRGNRQRCEYAMIGDVMNVAARLMQAAGGDIRCDSASWEAASSRFEFEVLPSIPVKGRERLLASYRPIHQSTSRPSDIIGRPKERRILHGRLEALLTSARRGVVILEGEAGIGKSRLVADLLEQAVARGVRAIVASGDEVERSTHYQVWRALFENLVAFGERADRQGLQRRVLQLLESNADLLPFAPLLNPVLGLNLPETERSVQVPPRGRAVLTRDLLVHLFRRTTYGHPTLLVLEDAHWFDSASWALAEGIQRELSEILLVVTLRPMSESEKPPELLRLSGLEEALAVRLDGLGPEESCALVCQRLRARALSEPIAQMIRDRAEGHPFFAEELAHALRDQGLVEIANGVCRFAGDATQQSVQLPNTVQVLVSSRIDQLTVPQQLTMKVASVFGRTFDLASLRAAYPIEVDELALQGHLQALSERDLVQSVSSEPIPTYGFKHAITQEVAYGLLTFELRRRLHQAVAQWYEGQYSDNQARIIPVLAHHWSRAQVPDRALLYLEKAGDQAMARFANEEAARFFSEALEIDGKLERQAAPDVEGWRGRVVSAQDLRRIRWYRQLGDAYINLGRWADGQAQFERALALAGLGLPSSDRRYALSLAYQILLQCARRFGGRRTGNLPEESADVLREAVRSYQRIGSISYLHDKMRPVAYTLVAALNLAEQLGPTPEFGLVCADVGNVLGLLSLKPLARAYHERARLTASKLPDPVAAARVIARTAVYRLGVGDWSGCQDLEALMLRCDQIGDSYLWEENASVRARAAHLRGEFELAAHLGAEIRRRSSATGSIGHEIWGIDCEAWASLYLGHHETALELADRGMRLLAKMKRTDRLAMLDFLGAAAAVYLSRGQLEQAQQAADRIFEGLAISPRPGFFAVLGLSAAAESFLTVWEADVKVMPESPVVRRALRTCRAIERYARVHSPARARALLWQGWAQALRGRSSAARAAWDRCLLESDRFSLPYENARAHYEIGRHLALQDPQRLVHLTLALEAFKGLKAEAEAARVAGALRIGRVVTHVPPHSNSESRTM